jgi:hypothetical protein
VDVLLAVRHRSSKACCSFPGSDFSAHSSERGEPGRWPTVACYGRLARGLLEHAHWHSPASAGRGQRAIDADFLAGVAASAAASATGTLT